MRLGVRSPFLTILPRVHDEPGFAAGPVQPRTIVRKNVEQLAAMAELAF
jgi:hypothetical protein